MARDLTTTVFGGSVPRRADHLTPVGSAVRALDCRLESGALDSWRVPRPLQTVPATARSVYQAFNCCWLTSTKCAHWAEGSVEQRHVFATQYNDYDYPVRIVLDGSCTPTVQRLGLPCPTERPTTNLNPSTAAKIAAANKGASSRHYAYQFEDSYGNRSSLSEPSQDVMVTDGANVLVQGWVIPAGGWDIQNIVLFRTVAGFESATIMDEKNSLDAVWMEVARIPAANLTYLDARPDADLDDALTDDVVDPPPAGMRGMTWVRSMNCLAGFHGRELLFSDNNNYHSWPYKLTLDDRIKAIVESNGVIYVATDGAPYVVSGAVDCANGGCRKAVRMPESLPLVGGGFRSLIALPSGAVYPSHQGLVQLTGGAAPVIASSPLYGQEDWHALHPDTMMGGYFEGRLYLFFRRGGFVMGIRDGAGTAGDTDAHSELSIRPNEVFVTRSGRLMMRVGDQVLEWDRGTTRMEHVYTGPLMQLGTPFNFGALQVLVDPLGRETVVLTADGFEALNETLDGSDKFALPLWATAQVFQWTLRGTARVTRVGIAPSFKEL